MGGDITGVMEYAGDLLTHLHVADSFDHRASSGLRYIVNPPGSTARIHQHLDIGQGEVDWDEFFGTLGRMKFDGIMTVCVFAWEERAHESSRYMPPNGMHIPLCERRTMHTNRAVVDAGRAKVDLWPGSLTTASQGGSLATWRTAPSPD